MAGKTIDERYRQLLAWAEEAKRPSRVNRRRKTIGKRKRRAVFDRDEWKCRKCGEDRRSELTVDHIIPVSRGGTDHRDNLQTLCGICNAEKGDRLEGEGLTDPVK